MICHRDEEQRERRDVGDMRSWWRDLGGAAGSTAVGVQRIEIDPGFRAGPVHVHGAEEEIFHVRGRAGLVWLEREAAAGPLEPPAPTPRPACVVALDDVPPRAIMVRFETVDDSWEDEA